MTETRTDPQPAATRPVGRPPVGDRAMTAAERASAYRARRAARLAALRDPVVPVSSALIDLSELPAWRRKP